MDLPMAFDCTPHKLIIAKLPACQSNIAIDWFTKNEMTINPDKFHAIILDRKKFNFINIPLTIDTRIIKSVLSVELLGIHLDDKLKFNLQHL